ncbi:unnamed protein product [Vitrella brassicaformis CCMP3155]|uniref:Uncharacterized protein n=1 Tax=Vitrella brassicaformis (strain CCMP3155) TaxID=1169540 RepID=A0A0G4E977_VITBC|nr:unnamed protein product [Vitrella brassicaformis CCMP3155]|eukprot:CEL92125.1 unnamed protein product [Vitrella brassicaformis CCMP3155]
MSSPRFQLNPRKLAFVADKVNSRPHHSPPASLPASQMSTVKALNLAAAGEGHDSPPPPVSLSASGGTRCVEDDGELTRTLKARYLSPKDKYTEPLVSSQEYGWWLDKQTAEQRHRAAKWRHPLHQCDIVNYATAYIQMTGKTPYQRKTQPAEPAKAPAKK